MRQLARGGPRAVRSTSVRAAAPRFRIRCWSRAVWFFTGRGADAAADGRAVDLLCEVAEAVADAAEAGSRTAEAGVGPDSSLPEPRPPADS